MRVFVALEVPDYVLDSLESFQRELSGSGADMKLVERENLHFTVKFLGEINEAQAAEADARLKALSLGSAKAEVKGVGAFPDVSRPRVVWAGVAKEQEGAILPAAQRVIESLDGIGERDDRPFRLHLTVARVRSDRNVAGLRGLIGRNSDRSFGSATFNSLKLKSSVLTPTGPVYRDVGVYPLQ